MAGPGKPKMAKKNNRQRDSLRIFMLETPESSLCKAGNTEIRKVPSYRGLRGRWTSFPSPRCCSGMVRISTNLLLEAFLIFLWQGTRFGLKSTVEVECSSFPTYKCHNVLRLVQRLLGKKEKAGGKGRGRETERGGRHLHDIIHLDNTLLNKCLPDVFKT